MKLEMVKHTFNSRKRDREFGSFNLSPIVAEKGGGGGSSGEIIYPSYFETYLTNWLADIDSFITSAQANNPYTGMSAYDTTTRTGSLATTTGNMNSLATYDPETEWDVFDGIANASFTANHSSSYVDSVIDSLESDQEVNHMNAVARYSAQMSEINAVMTSSYFIGLGQLEQEFVRGLTHARSELTAEFERKRTGYIIQACAQMTQLFGEQKRLGMHGYDSEIEVEKVSIIAEKEEVDLNNQFNVDEILWDLELYKYGSNMMAGPAGGTASTQPQSTTAQTALGGALTGAALGFQAAGPAGGVIGGIGGLIAGLF